MTFQLHTPPLSSGDPSHNMVAAFQARFDALSPTDNANAEVLLEKWGWRQTANPAAYWRLFERALEALGG